jgi:hypothetical protein
MAYLIPRDYLKVIQTDNLQQIIAGDQSVLTNAENMAYETAIENLVQKYAIANELQDTSQFDITVAYKAGMSFFINFKAFDSALAYSLGDLATYNGVCFVCSTATTAGTFDISKFTSAGTQYQIFSSKYPEPVFSIKGQYKIGDQVFYKDKVYTCAVSTSGYGQEQKLQYGSYSNLPQINVLPDDTEQGTQYWGSGVDYSIPAGTLPNVSAYYFPGDNRCQRLVSVLVDIVLHEVHSRIAPRNIPELRVKRFDDGMRWLKQCAKGDVTPNITALQPRQGGRIRFGGNIKNNNTY